MKQIKFSFLKDYKKEFGGELLIGKRRAQRPLSCKKPIHLVLRSPQNKVFTPNNKSLDKLIRKTALRFQIKIYDLALNWSHIHSVISIQHRSDYNKFIRALTSIMAQRIRSKLGSQIRVFTLRPFTRILEWGRDLRNAFEYLVLNQLESFGLIRRPTKKQPIPRKIQRKTNSLTAAWK